ncbi:PAM68 family protein [Calothrix sp. UHCC 0171]|uniref:PAM68 family protein n=1 Tax=Calothrix sp. UHCC 0171 TaxID=3110245 RepID=UPI002B1EBD95|nr:PAM68 family protein [Calothrix sp. UHCC 0171]MEA5574006.1 PAM68 family protein [Calothrix sp. UHCC 0171]
MSAESERNNLPFEPKAKQKKPAKAKTQPIVKTESSQKESQKPPFTKEEMAIPKVVSDRMIRRVAGFSGIPTALGIFTLVASYLLVAFAEIKLPPIVVLLLNMGFFGLGVLGITYGVLSTSWDTDRPGTLFGWGEFTTNWGRMVEGWRATRQKKV